MNLDGKAHANDVTNPAGEKGIDTELFRVLGCIECFRGPDTDNNFYDTKLIITDRYNRMLIELTGLDGLENDDDATGVICRDAGRLLSDTVGNTIGSNGIPVARSGSI
ncbi:MAG: hypothetical protein IT566_16360 [Rhodospirillaceae bacterium]|nr:hypothetical protein [Rhodospirillaceae bacterium]